MDLNHGGWSDGELHLRLSLRRVGAPILQVLPRSASLPTQLFQHLPPELELQRGPLA